jgi:predicted nucleotidyltransferase
VSSRLKKLKEEIVSLLPNNLVSMIVFGSYSRGDYKPDSDIDMIVVVKNKTKNVIKLMQELEASLMDASHNFVEKRFSKFLDNIGYKKNIFLFSLNDWRKKKFAPFCEHDTLSRIMIPKGIIWRDIKNQGKVLYGKNLLNNLEPKVSIWDRIKAPLPGIFACLFASLLFLFARDKAIAVSQTGVKWTYQNVMGVMQRSELTSIWKNFLQVLKISLGRI